MQMLTTLHRWAVSIVVSQNHGKMRGDVSCTGPYPMFPV